MTKAVKVYYSIGEVSSMFNVNTSLIRFWEKEFDVLKPKKNNKGNRLFTERDVTYLHMIYHLVKEKGYTLQGAKDELKNNHQEVETKVALLATLQHVKNFLTGLDSELAIKATGKK
jgi:DNA-binding transcriptional MerR regulator